MSGKQKSGIKKEKKLVDKKSQVCYIKTVIIIVIKNLKINYQIRKGENSYDEEFGKACVSFEATHTLPQNIIQRLKNEFNVTIVK